MAINAAGSPPVGTGGPSSGSVAGARVERRTLAGRFKDVVAKFRERDDGYIVTTCAVQGKAAHNHEPPNFSAARFLVELVDSFMDRPASGVGANSSAKALPSLEQ